MEDFYVDGKSYRVGWDYGRWRVFENSPWLSFDRVLYVSGASDMPPEELANQIRYWQKIKGNRYERD